MFSGEYNVSMGEEISASGNDDPVWSLVILSVCIEGGCIR